MSGGSNRRGEVMAEPSTATWVAAGAAVAAAILAAVQIGREWWHERIRKRSVRSRIEASAYHLRRQLHSWLGKSVGDENEDEREEHLEKWIRDCQNRGGLKVHLDLAEERMDHLMALRPDASPQAGRALERAFIYFLEGTRRLNEYVTMGRPNQEDMWEWTRLRIDAQKDLREVIDELERYILRPTLVTEHDLQVRRDIEDPFNQLANAMLSQAQNEESQAIRPPEEPSQPRQGD